MIFVAEEKGELTMRLIDADALLQAKREKYMAEIGKLAHGDFRALDEQNATVLLIYKQPTIEAEPIKHGRWVYRDSLSGGGGAWWHCSECGRLEIFVEGYFHKHCPRCGAKMDEEGEA